MCSMVVRSEMGEAEVVKEEVEEEAFLSAAMLMR